MNLIFNRYDINYNLILALKNQREIIINENDVKIEILFKNYKDYENFKLIKYFFTDFEEFRNILKFFNYQMSTGFNWYSYNLFIEGKVASLREYKFKSFEKKIPFDEMKFKNLINVIVDVMKICRENTYINNYDDFERYTIKQTYNLLKIKKHYIDKIFNLFVYDDKILNISFDLFVDNITSDRSYFNILNKMKKNEIYKFQNFVNSHNIKWFIHDFLSKHPFEFVFNLINKINKFDYDMIFCLEIYSDEYSNKKHYEVNSFLPVSKFQHNLFEKDLSKITSLKFLKNSYKIKEVKPLLGRFPFSDVEEILTTKGLYIESTIMKHCIRNYSYKWPLHRFFHLHLGEEHSTLEISLENSNIQVIQHRGKYNRTPSLESTLLAIKFLKFLSYRLECNLEYSKIKRT